MPFRGGDEGVPLQSPLQFIIKVLDEGYIVGPQKKSVAIYAMGEKRL